MDTNKQESQEGVEEQIAERILPILRTLASQEYQRGALYNHEGTFTRGFEAGRLQGIADAVAVVPKDDELLHKECVDRKKELCDVCFSKMMLNKEHKLILTALSSLTHKK